VDTVHNAKPRVTGTIIDEAEDNEGVHDRGLPATAGELKRWRDGDMAMRWCAAGMVEAGKQFRRVNGHLHLANLRAALEREVTETGGSTRHDDLVSVA